MGTHLGTHCAAYPHFIRLEGVCWDFTIDGVWPVLVFRKAGHGNLREFLWSEEGKNTTFAQRFAQRIQICSEIGSAIMTMHAFRKISRKINSRLGSWELTGCP